MAPHDGTLPAATNAEKSAPQGRAWARAWARLPPWFWTLSSQLFGLLWLGPMIALLVLNFKNSIIGASVWCPMGKCPAEALSKFAISRAQKLDKDDHNILGGLQFVAKFLEVWFVFVATSLVYNCTMLLASKGKSLPIGFLMTHLEFTDLSMLLNCRFWKTAASPKGSILAERTSTFKLFLFAFSMAFMCILANLMGPASAILVLPSLQWVDLPKHQESRFDRINLENAPTGDLMSPDCSPEILAARNYSCNADTHESSLDSLVGTGASSYDQIYANGNHGFGSGHVLFQEQGAKFMLNTTGYFNDTSSHFWVPNRQLLRHLSNDLEELYHITLNRSFDHPLKRMYQNSLQTVLKRRGPILAVKFNPYMIQNTSITTITQDKQIRCYSAWIPPAVEHVNKTYTKCNRVGLGWNPSNINASFIINGVNSSESVASVNAYFSDKSMYKEYIPGSFPPSCIATGSAPSDGSCDWEKYFSLPNLPPASSNFSSNILTIEIGSLNLPSDQRIVLEFAVQSKFSTYTLDSSRITNPLHVVQVDDFIEPTKADSVVIHPDWLLAAWSVDQNGKLPADRPAASGLVRGIELGLDVAIKYITDKSVGLDTSVPKNVHELVRLMFPVLVSFLQAMSMITYQNSSAQPSASDNDPIHPILWRQATLRVWAWGSDGRSSMLAVVVICLGILCVLVRTVLMFYTRSPQRSPTHLVVAALDYQPQGEFTGVNIEDEKATSKIRYEMSDDEKGRFQFRPVFRNPVGADNSQITCDGNDVAVYADPSFTQSLYPINSRSPSINSK